MGKVINLMDALHRSLAVEGQLPWRAPSPSPWYKAPMIHSVANVARLERAREVQVDLAEEGILSEIHEERWPLASRWRVVVAAADADRAGNILARGW